jgi:ADP-heptose:LPS heptosyltransferase
VRPPQHRQTLTVWYHASDVREQGSVLAGMCRVSGCDYQRADFRLPIPAEWQAKASALIEHWKPTKPIMIHRPLIVRSEWGGCAKRNPDHAHYAELYEAIRDRFFVVSVADLVSKVEWQVGKDVDVDVKLHGGELPFEALAALFSRAALVYASPGFAVPLAQAVETPVICVFGGFENSTSFLGGARYSPYCGIDTVRPCDCWSHNHNCEKRIDMSSALKRVQDFAAHSTEGAKGIPEYPAA